jgi:nucleoid DNA-binding protein
VEEVLLFMATQIARLSPMEHVGFKEMLNDSIKLYPGNWDKSEKTINNWRTEISALFGLIETEGTMSKPGRMALLLSKEQDLISFFRYFLFYFQYPGGHLKPDCTREMILSGIRFKPAKYIIEVLLEGMKRAGTESKFGITKAEVTHLIFNDLRVTRDRRSAAATVDLLLQNRVDGIQYDNQGDVIRYAGDILDYLGLADLVTLRPNYQYYLNTIAIEAIDAFIKSDLYFKGYEKFYGEEEVVLSDITNTQDEWFAFVNSELTSDIFKADALSIIEEFSRTSSGKKEASKLVQEVLASIRGQLEKGEKVPSQEIGDAGEALAIQHEKNRLTKMSREDLVHLVVKMPEHLGVGYDVKSYNGSDDSMRHIEVKTTTSTRKLASGSFLMSTNEWRAAKAYRKEYYIYRFMISKEDISLFVIEDPVGKERDDKLMMVPRNGAEIIYSDKSGYWEKLLA